MLRPLLRHVCVKELYDPGMRLDYSIDTKVFHRVLFCAVYSETLWYA
jgi:hypothetical protein